MYCIVVVIGAKDNRLRETCIRPFACVSKPIQKCEDATVRLTYICRIVSPKYMFEAFDNMCTAISSNVVFTQHKL